MKVISLGWGVQSWTLAAMVALGELEPVDVTLHSDTTWERQATYEFARRWTPWLEERGVRVVTVRDDHATKATVDSQNDNVFIPAFMSNKVQVVNQWIEIPAYHTYPDGTPSGMLRRQCTGRWKVDPMKRWLTEELALLGLKKSPGIVEQWLGITLDEIERVRESDVKWQVLRYPLLEKKMTRQACINWLQSNGLPVPPKSSCVFCPYHRRVTWAEMKRDNGPDWKAAVEVDEAIRDKRPGYVAYVHPDRIPLIELKITEDFGASQLSFVDTSNAECDSGYCFL